jgi:hypothetical protein
MATSRSATLALLQAAVLLVLAASLAGSSAVTLPEISVVSFKVKNDLTESLDVTLVASVAGVSTPPTSAKDIQPGASKTVAVQLEYVTGPIATTVTFTVGSRVYRISPSLQATVVSETGTLKVEVSAPCPHGEPGLYLHIITPGGLANVQRCTGPPVN